MKLDKKRIFAFWEPKENLPAYLKLCIKTWERFLSDYEIVILDYSNIDKWLDKNFFDKTLYSDYTLPKQADAIRCALLKKYGGIWFDCDTIITSENFKEFLKIDSNCIMLGRHIGFIIANQNAKILRIWLKAVKRNLLLHKLCKKKFFRKIYSLFDKNFVKYMDDWDFLGNRILNKYMATMQEKDFYSIDKIKYSAFPEEKMLIEKDIERTSENRLKAYVDFYFTNNDYTEYTLENTSGIISLHNSWTPDKYKNMSEEEFLEQDITLAKILKKLVAEERE